MSARQARAERSAGIAPEFLVPQLAFLKTTYVFGATHWQRLNSATLALIGTTWHRSTLAPHAFAKSGLRSSSTSSRPSSPCLAPFPKWRQLALNPQPEIVDRLDPDLPEADFDLVRAPRRSTLMRL